MKQLPMTLTMNATIGSAATIIVHTNWPNDPDGLSGVREPRRPLPHSNGPAASELPADAHSEAV